MTGIKNDGGKPASYLVAHDVVETESQKWAPHTPDELAEFLRRWWVRGGPLGGMVLSQADYFGLVAVLEFGAKKYAPRNWEAGIVFHRVFRAAMDHYARMDADGEGVDDETGLPHRYHFLCCYMFLAAYVARGMHHLDDRPGVGPYVLAAAPSAEAGPFGVFFNAAGSALRSFTMPLDYATRAEAQAAIDMRLRLHPEDVDLRYEIRSLAK